VSVGDKLLIAFADFIRSFEVGVIASRDYADCIMTLSFTDSKEAAYQIIQASNKSFCEEQNKLYPEINIQLSSGIYLFNPKDRDINAGIDNANIARKLIKREKMHGVSVFETYMLDEIKHQSKIITDFKKALKQKEFLLYLQPQINIENGSVFGAEALVRWQKKDGQFIYPNDFIPVLEKSGDIVELDFYMLERVLQFLVKWKKSGVAIFPISVNFSRLHLFNPDFGKKVLDRIRKYEIDPQYIDIEITESVFVKDYERVVNNIEEIRRNGITVSIDDFGTGYSSLNVLTKVTVDSIKIDKSFLAHAEKDYATRSIVEYTIDLAQKLNMGIICEGVETESQLDLIKTANCKVVQGYYFDKPIDQDLFENKYMENLLK
jgi:EAL domain-containing protein (putative c-di-GMP-specific phosphodiesterase class I)